MRFALMSEPQQGLTYEEILALVQTAEEAGFEAYFRSDHYGSFPAGSGKPTTDAWATLAGLARETSRISVGTLVSPVTFRQPGNLAKMAATVAEMADGRLEIGLGAGWNDVEHRQHGLPFPERASASRCSRSSWRSCMAYGPSPMAGATRAATGRCPTRCSTPSPRRCRAGGIRTS